LRASERRGLPASHAPHRLLPCRFRVGVKISCFVANKKRLSPLNNSVELFKLLLFLIFHNCVKLCVKNCVKGHKLPKNAVFTRVFTQLLKGSITMHICARTSLLRKGLKLEAV